MTDKVLIGPLEKWNNDLTDEKADIILTDQVTYLMKWKLAKKRKQGYGGWHKLNECSNEQLLQSLKEHVEKGDMVDVINFAGMITCRTGMYGNKA